MHATKQPECRRTQHLTAAAHLTWADAYSTVLGSRVTPTLLTPMSDTNELGLYRSRLDSLALSSQVVDAPGQLCDIF